MTQNNKTISIIGCGWFGYPMALKLIEKGYTVLGTTTGKEKLTSFTKNGIKAFQFRLTDPLPEALSQSNIALISIPPRRKVMPTNTYLQGLEKLANELKAGQVDKVIFISTTGIYPDDEPLAQENATALKSPFVEAEKIWLDRFEKCLILRFAGLFGPHRLAGRFLAAKKGLADKPINMLHLNDALGFCQYALSRQLEGIYNVCSPQHPFRSEFYPKASQQLGLEPPTFSQIEKSKTVSSDKSLKSGYQYQFPNPIEAL
ncbi:NAD(P)-binding domain-containing protein [Persicobacter diffluens]|uniref:NAD(P)-dependent oxidoreductase n=1 Tax=Persicobacter diffluens TaxID=981 RepID=A0AAN4W0X3_9BACT|nr:NAD(P)-dependent oxidoreductase [Persicobacter diffluens]